MSTPRLLRSPGRARLLDAERTRPMPDAAPSNRRKLEATLMAARSPPRRRTQRRRSACGRLLGKKSHRRARLAGPSGYALTRTRTRRGSRRVVRAGPDGRGAPRTPRRAFYALGRVSRLPTVVRPRRRPSASARAATPATWPRPRGRAPAERGPRRLGRARRSRARAELPGSKSARRAPACSRTGDPALASHAPNSLRGAAPRSARSAWVVALARAGRPTRPWAARAFRAAGLHIYGGRSCRASERAVGGAPAVAVVAMAVRVAKRVDVTLDAGSNPSFLDGGAGDAGAPRRGLRVRLRPAAVGSAQLRRVRSTRAIRGRAA